MAGVPVSDESWRPSRPVPPLLREGPVDEEAPTRPTSAARLIYLLLALVPFVLGAIVLLVRTGVVGNPARAERPPWDLGVVLLGVAVTLIMVFTVARRAPEVHARATSIGFDRRDAWLELVTLLLAMPVAILLSTVGLLAWSGVVQGYAWLNTDPMAPPILAALAILVSGAPGAYFTLVSGRRTRAMEERFPDLLRDLNESHAAGMTMAQAIRVASRGDYGALNPEVRRMARQVSWGVSFQDALRMFAERVPTPLVTRAVALVIKATRAGGNVKDVLAAAARDAREIKTIEADRRAGMALYVIVIYVAFGVFLAVTAALQGLLVPSVLGSTRGLSGIGNVAFSDAMGVQDFRHLYFSVGVIQALGSGVVAGVMSEGKASAGLKHATIMVGVALVVLGLLL